MKIPLRVLALSALLNSPVLSRGAEYFADQVLGYTPGAGVGEFTNPAAALGKPGGNIGAGTFNPFSPNTVCLLLIGAALGVRRHR